MGHEESLILVAQQKMEQFHALESNLGHAFEANNDDSRKSNSVVGAKAVLFNELPLSLKSLKEVVEVLKFLGLIAGKVDCIYD